MDRETLLAHRAAWVREPRPHSGRLERLTPEEGELYEELLHGVHGTGVRLEQERVGFGWLRRELAQIAPLQ
jgi:hypothetical protein